MNARRSVRLALLRLTMNRGLRIRADYAGARAADATVNYVGSRRAGLGNRACVHRDVVDQMVRDGLLVKVKDDGFSNWYGMTAKGRRFGRAVIAQMNRSRDRAI